MAQTWLDRLVNELCNPLKVQPVASLSLVLLTGVLCLFCLYMFSIWLLPRLKIIKLCWVVVSLFTSILGICTNIFQMARTSTIDLPNSAIDLQLAGCGCLMEVQIGASIFCVSFWNICNIAIYCPRDNYMHGGVHDIVLDAPHLTFMNFGLTTKTIYSGKLA